MEVNAHHFSPYLWGVGGAFCITSIFYLVQALGMQSLEAPVGFMLDRWYLVAPLIVGFGIQVGVFRAIHLLARHGGGGTMAASGSISSGTMLMCCMHNLVLLFPILGVSGLAVFFSTYQTQVFLVSIVVSYFGVGYMIWKYQTIRRACASHHPSTT
ncbi:MAG: hypothetical protein WC654_01500 [Patescibacteria group bacterium]